MRRVAWLALVGWVTACGREVAPAPDPPSPSVAVAMDAVPAPVLLPPPVPPAPPALLTADEITAASATWTAGPARTAAGEVDGAALRQAHHARLKADASPVTLLIGGDARSLGARLCEAVVPKVPVTTPVLIKPNIGGFDWFKTPSAAGGDDGLRGRITDPEFVRGIVQCLRGRGHTRITIADGWTHEHAQWQKLTVRSGYAAMAADEGVALVALNDDGVFDVEGDRPARPLTVRGMDKTSAPTLMMPQIVADHLAHGLYISAPKIKAHRFAVFSAAIKGTQGATMYSDASPAYRLRGRTHKEIGGALAALKRGDRDGRSRYVRALRLFATRMVDVFEVQVPHVVLAEGAPAKGGDGFQRMVPIAPAIAIGGTHAVRVDRVIAQWLGLWDNAALAAELDGARTSPLLTEAAARFGLSLDEVPVTGDGAALLQVGRPTYFAAMAGFAIGDPARVNAVGATAPATATIAGPGIPAWPPGGAARIDGEIEPAWTAHPAWSFAQLWSGAASPIETTVRLRWSEAGLDVLWELASLGEHTDRSRPPEVEHPSLYKENCVEVFIAPDADARDRWFEIEAGPHGHFLDLAISRAPRKHDATWASGVIVASRVDPATRRGVIEMRVPWTQLGVEPTVGRELALGLYRIEGQAPRAYLAAFPTKTPKPNFHVPEAFARVRLDP